MNDLKEKLLNTNYFIDNYYLNLYIELVRENENTLKQFGVTQSHHILPRSYFVIINQNCDHSKENLVNLKYSDHILAHYYLCYCTIKSLKRANFYATKQLINIENFNLEDFCKINLIDYDTWYKDFIDNISGGNNYAAKPVICLENQKIYGSITEAARAIDVSPGNVGKCCRGVQLSCKKMHFQFLEDYKKNPQTDLKCGRGYRKKVLCLDNNTIYESAAEASRQLQVNKTHICDCCKGRIQSTGGLHFVYYND